MSGFIIKSLLILFISGAAAGAHVWVMVSGGQSLKLTPDEPTRTVLKIPSRDIPTPSETPEQSEEVPSPDVESTENPEASSQSAGEDTEEPADVGSSGELVLDTLEIDLATSQALFENGLATFVDARPAAEFELGHIQGSMNISPPMFDDLPVAQVDFIDPMLPIVVYCGGGDCDDSHRVVQLLQQLYGLNRTHVFVDGFPAWSDAGLPVGTGPDPLGDL